MLGSEDFCSTVHPSLPSSADCFCTAFCTYHFCAICFAVFLLLSHICKAPFNKSKHLYFSFKTAPVVCGRTWALQRCACLYTFVILTSQSSREKKRLDEVLTTLYAFFSKHSWSYFDSPSRKADGEEVENLLLYPVPHLSFFFFLPVLSNDWGVTCSSLSLFSQPRNWSWSSWLKWGDFSSLWQILAAHQHQICDASTGQPWAVWSDTWSTRRGDIKKAYAVVIPAMNLTSHHYGGGGCSKGHAVLQIISPPLQVQNVWDQVTCEPSTFYVQIAACLLEPGSFQI